MKHRIWIFVKSNKIAVIEVVLPNGKNSTWWLWKKLCDGFCCGGAVSTHSFSMNVHKCIITTIKSTEFSRNNVSKRRVFQYLIFFKMKFIVHCKIFGWFIKNLESFFLFVFFYKLKQKHKKVVGKFLKWEHKS